MQTEEEGGEDLVDAEGAESDDADDVDSELEQEDEREAQSLAKGRLDPLVKPFLPLTCAPCSSSLVSTPATSVCAKYRPASPSGPSSGLATSPLHPDFLDHSVLFAGTGSEVRRVLKRAMRSSLYGGKRRKEGSEGEMQKFDGEEPFRILVLGGSGESRPFHRRRDRH